MDPVAGVDGLGEAVEGAVLVERGGGADVYCGEFAFGWELGGEQDVVAELPVEGGDDDGDRGGIEAGVLDGDAADFDAEVAVAVGGDRAVEVEVYYLRRGDGRLRDDGLDAAFCCREKFGFTVHCSLLWMEYRHCDDGFGIKGRLATVETYSPNGFC